MKSVVDLLTGVFILACRRCRTNTRHNITQRENALPRFTAACRMYGCEMVRPLTEHEIITLQGLFRAAIDSLSGDLHDLVIPDTTIIEKGN